MFAIIQKICGGSRNLGDDSCRNSVADSEIVVCDHTEILWSVQSPEIGLLEIWNRCSFDVPEILELVFAFPLFSLIDEPIDRQFLGLPWSIGGFSAAQNLQIVNADSPSQPEVLSNH
jgi:hypothetical protein